MDSFERIKRRVILWLHRWLVRLRLLKHPHREPVLSDADTQSQEIVTSDDEEITIETPAAITVHDPSKITITPGDQATIENPAEIVIEGDTLITITDPVTVVIEDSELSLLQNTGVTDEHENLFMFPCPETVTVHDSGGVTTHSSSNDREN